MNLKLPIIIALVLASFEFSGFSQTNGSIEKTNVITQTKDLRVVNGRVYDVMASKDWVSITIPAGTGLLNEGMIHFTGTVKPIDVTFSIPTPTHGATTVFVRNFPYDAKYFARKTPFIGIGTKFPLNLRVFPLSHPTTNWNLLGEMKIIPAKPTFDYGLPFTNENKSIR